MRLLHVTHQYRPAIGGAEHYITSLSEELALRGHRVTVFASRSRDYVTWRTELPGFEELAGVRVHRFRSLVRGAHTWRILDYGYRSYWRTRSCRYEPLIFLGNGPVCFRLFWAMLRQASDYDLVHINNLHYAHAAMAYLAAKRRNLPVVLTPHIHIEQPVTYDVRYMQTILKGSDHIIADTQAEREFLIEAGLDHQRITTAGVGLGPEMFSIRDKRACRQELGLPAEAFVLLFLGRKTEYKGLDLTLKAFATLQQQHPHLYLLAVGQETDYSRALWARYERLPHLVIHESVPNKTRLTVLNACDCLVMPSTGEAFGIVFLEAWAVGKPVIGARTPAVSSLIADEGDGYLIPTDSVSQLTDRIAWLLQNPDLGQRMGERGRTKVMNRYTVPRITDIVEGIYLRVLRRHRRRVGQTISPEAPVPQHCHNRGDSTNAGY
jgi:glycosyltransferase involved in cell wall biosynthesis